MRIGSMLYFFLIIMVLYLCGCSAVPWGFSFFETIQEHGRERGECMIDFIIIMIVAALLSGAVCGSVRHFKGTCSCCGKCGKKQGKIK